MKFGNAALLAVIILTAFAGGLRAQTKPGAQYLVPFPAYRVIGNVYFVGTQTWGFF